MSGETCNRPEAGRSSAVERVLWIVLLLNMAVAAAKFFYGLASGSTSMRADGIHSFFDGFGNVVGIIALAMASRPADQSHPYGHAKFETYGSLIIGVLLLAAAFEVGSSAVQKLVTGAFTAEVSALSFYGHAKFETYGSLIIGVLLLAAAFEVGSSAVQKLVTGAFTAEVSALSFVVMVGTMAVNIAVTCYERACGKRYHSEILMADASHTLSDAFVSLGVIAGLILVKMGFPAADPVMALVVTAAILVTAFGVFRTALRTLSDHSRISPEAIAQAASSVADVSNVHHVRTRGTEGEVYCDLHIQVDPDMTVFRAHALADEVEAVLKRQFPSVIEVLVHVEPLGDEGAGETPILGQDSAVK